MKKCFCKLQASVPIHSTTGGYANVEGSLQIKKCRKYAQHAIKCNFLYQSHTQGSFIPIFPLIFASVLFRIFLCSLYYPKCYFLSGKEPIWCFSEDLAWPDAVCAPWNPFLLHHLWSLTNLFWWKGSEPSTLKGVWWNSNMLATPKGQGKHPRVQELQEGWTITSSSSQHSWMWLSCSNPQKKIPFSLFLPL